MRNTNIVLYTALIMTWEKTLIKDTPAVNVFVLCTDTKMTFTVDDGIWRSFIVVEYGGTQLSFFSDMSI